MCAAVVGAGDGAEALLAGGIPLSVVVGRREGETGKEKKGNLERKACEREEEEGRG